MRATGTTSDVTETQHVQVPATTRHRRQARHVVSPLIAVERVEQPAIEHRLKHSAQTVQVQGIGNREVSVYAATRSLLPRDRQCGLSHIDSQNVQPQRGDVKGVLACPASYIEDRAGECAFARQTQYRWLWSSYVPWRRAIEVRRIPGLARPPLVTGGLPPAVRIVGSDSGPLGHLHPFPATGVAEPHRHMQRSLRQAEPRLAVELVPHPDEAHLRCTYGHFVDLLGMPDVYRGPSALVSDQQHAERLACGGAAS